MFLIDMILNLIVKAFFGIITLFLFYIEVCDAVIIIFLTWVIMGSLADWNGWASVALGAAISLVLYIIFRHRIGFWIITPLFSFVWTFLLIELLLKGAMMPDISPTAYWICAVLCFLAVVWLHSVAKDRPEIDAREAAASEPRREEQAAQEQWYDPRIQELRPIDTKPLEAYDPNWKYYSKRNLKAERE